MTKSELDDVLRWGTEELFKDDEGAEGEEGKKPNEQEIIWDDGPQCSVEFTVDEVVELSDVSPLRWGQAELSPANPA